MLQRALSTFVLKRMMKDSEYKNLILILAASLVCVQKAPNCYSSSLYLHHILRSVVAGSGSSKDGGEAGSWEGVMAENRLQLGKHRRHIVQAIQCATASKRQTPMLHLPSTLNSYSLFVFSYSYSECMCIMNYNIVQVFWLRPWPVFKLMTDNNTEFRSSKVIGCNHISLSVVTAAEPGQRQSTQNIKRNFKGKDLQSSWQFLIQYVFILYLFYSVFFCCSLLPCFTSS